MSAYRLKQSELRVVSINEREELLEQLGREIDSHTEIQSPYRNKMKMFLAESGIGHVTEVDVAIRQNYLDYLKQNISSGAISAYMKAFDRIKQHSVREQIQTLRGKREVLADLERQVIFLPYHPEPEIANQFEYFVKTDNLIWDFKQKTPQMMKKQIFNVLHSMLRRGMNVSSRCSELTALKRFYEYCVKEQILDIEYLEQKQIDKFMNMFSNKRERECAGRILNRCREVLFIEADEIHWHANIWYLERFHFEKARTDPSKVVKTISFIEVGNKENRRHLQQYMKYCLGVTRLTIGVIRTEFIFVRNFMVWLDNFEPQNVCNISENTMKQYFRYQDRTNIKEDEYNRIIMSIVHFFAYLQVRRKIEKIPFCEQYYLKKAVPKHIDRSVEDKIYTEIIAKLKLFPEDLRLMFLHLWAIGLRASEVCSLKGNAYYVQGRDAWIQVYQIKIQNYKRIPIPWVIHRLMTVYLEKYQIGPDDYIFQNEKGGAHSYWHFRYRMLKCCKENQIGNGEYLFKSHDYRHTVATMYYENGVSLQSVRDYLGHDYEEMTSRYIDYMPKKIDKANEKYFEQGDNNLASGITRCKREK